MARWAPTCKHPHCKPYILVLSLSTQSAPAQAQSARFAAVWLWDTATWAPVGRPLEAHTLTVTQLAFSPAGDRLLSVSRDRSLAVYERAADGGACTSRVALNPSMSGSPRERHWGTKLCAGVCCAEGALVRVSGIISTTHPTTTLPPPNTIHTHNHTPLDQAPIKTTSIKAVDQGPG